MKKAKHSIQWYEDNRAWKRRISQGFRALSILTVAVGTLCPLIDAAYSTSPNELGQWGYVAFALAAAFVGADRFFGVSSSWMRFTIARMEIERALTEFEFDWKLLKAGLHDKPLSSESFQVCLKTIKNFSLRIQDIVKQETESWITEFQHALAELAKTAKAEIKARRPGDLAVNITNANEFDGGLTVSVAGRERAFEGSSALINDIPPGNYEVKVVGTKGGKTSSEVKVAEILPGAIANIEMTLSIT